MGKIYGLACVVAVLICIAAQSSDCSITGIGVGWKNCTSSAMGNLIHKKPLILQLNIDRDVCQLTAYDKDNQTIFVTTVAHFYNDLSIDTNLITPGVRYKAPWFIGSCHTKQCAQEINLFSKAVKGLVCCNRVNSDNSCGSSNTVQLITGQQKGIATVVNNYFVTTGVITGYLGPSNNATGSGLLLQQNGGNPSTLMKTGYSAAYDVGGCGALTDNVIDITTVGPVAQGGNAATGNTVIVTSNGNILIDVTNVGIGNVVTDIAQLISGLTGSQTATGLSNAVSTATSSICSTSTCIPGTVANAGFSWVDPANCSSTADANESGCIALNQPSPEVDDPGFYIPISLKIDNTGSTGYLPPGGPYPGGIVPKNAIPSSLIRSNDIVDDSNDGLVKYLPTLPINLGDENEPPAFGLVADCPNILPGGYSLSNVKDADIINSNARLNIVRPDNRVSTCTASLLNTFDSEGVLRGLDTTAINPKAFTRFFVTAAHCWFGAADYVIKGKYTVGKATLCFGTGLKGYDRDGKCPAGRLWNVVQLKTTNNAAVFMPNQPLDVISRNVDIRKIDLRQDYSVFAATPANINLPGLCEPGRNFRAIRKDDVGTFSDSGCGCVQRDHNAVNCVFGCPCLGYNCDPATCTQVSKTGWYVQGYPGPNPGPGTRFDGNCISSKVDSNLLIQSSFLQNAASVAACDQAFGKAKDTDNHVLLTPGYACPGMSGAGVSHPLPKNRNFVPEIVGTLSTGTNQCPEPGEAKPSDGFSVLVAIAPIRCISNNEGINPYGVKGCYNTVNAAIDALCRTGAKGCTINECNKATTGK